MLLFDYSRKYFNPGTVCLAWIVVWVGSLKAAQPAVAIHPGRVAAQTYCILCHLVPKPDCLDRKTWRDELLPKMKYMMGLESPPPGYFHDESILRTNGFFPKSPMVSSELFAKISDYYIEAAPEKLLPVSDTNRVPTTLTLFTPIPATHRRSPPITTLVRIDPKLKAIAMGDATAQGLDFLDAQGKRVTSIALGNIPVRMTETPTAYWIAAIGHFFPREEPRGQVIRLDKTDQGLKVNRLVSNLPRTTDVQAADLNGDGIEDFTLCAFGNMIGRFSWWEGTKSGEYREHILLDKPGSIQCRIHDFNGDGKPDLAVLQAQWLESLSIFINLGDGRFEKHLIFQHPPSWGHSSFDLADFDGDGKLDFLVTNGDNADFTTSPPKSYHGARIYLRRDKLNFEEAYFFPLTGAFCGLARDFDQDGDIDIALTSFFPDYDNAPREGFVFLENQGGLKFKASTFRQSMVGRWITMDAGDLDGDGDEDLVLASLIKMPTVVPESLKSNWEERGPSVLILRNNLIVK